MPDSSSSEYVIYHPEKLRFSDVFGAFVFRRTLEGSKFIESNRRLDGTKLPTIGDSPITILTLILQKILIWISEPLKLLGIVVEFTLNLFSINGGFLLLIFNLVTGKLVIPKRGSAEFRSIIGHIDSRTHLMTASSIQNCHPLNSGGELSQFDLSMMAAKISYENKAYVENVVTNIWKMYFVGHYNFWNESLKSEDTQAFVCCDREVDAQVIVVAFRGTEPFNARDWITDIDLSFMPMGELGRAHVGFMYALGLQDATDYKKGWPKDYTGTKCLAYYRLRELLKTLLQENTNARIIVTGHSLGGALAVVFPSILVLHHEEDILSRFMGVYTYGQPRVGDKEFGTVMNSQLNVIFKRYFRVVYRYDVVPRVPFDDPISQFAHFGGCLYYRSWYKGEVRKEEVNPNYFNPLYIPSKYFNATLDLLRGIVAWIWPGRDYKESLISILYRVSGLLFPGVASHSPRDYVNGVRLIRVLKMEEKDDEETLDF